MSTRMQRLQMLMDLAEAGDRKNDAEAMREQAMADITERVSKAHAAGVPIAEISRNASLSRQTIYKLLGMR